VRTVLATAATVLLLVPTGGGTGKRSGSIPWLTAAEKSQAARILASDPRTKAIFDGASYTVADIGPFTANDDRKIGAAMTICLDAPRSFPIVEWPAIEPDWTPGSSLPHYRERTLSASAADVSDFDVLVDLNRARLISLRPRNAKKMTIAPGWRRGRRRAATDAQRFAIAKS
jgi:hypothetical protein